MIDSQMHNNILNSQQKLAHKIDSNQKVFIAGPVS